VSDRVLLHPGGWLGENPIAGVEYLIIIVITNFV